jgi:hypothetical protein
MHRDASNPCLAGSANYFNLKMIGFGLSTTPTPQALYARFSL